MEYTEELAALKAIQKQVNERVKELEFSIKREMLDQDGGEVSDRRKISVAGYEVGTYILVTPKLSAQIVPGREAEALSFLTDLGLTEVTPVKGWEKAFIEVGGKALHKDTGEFSEAIQFYPSGAAYVRANGFKPETVKDAFQARGIEQREIYALLGGNE